MPQRTKYPVKKFSLRGASDPDNGKIATNGPYISDSDHSELRSRRVKKRPRAADAISSDLEISESSSDNPAETFSPSLAKVKTIQDHLKSTLKMVAELERDLSLQEEEQEE